MVIFGILICVFFLVMSILFALLKFVFKVSSVILSTVLKIMGYIGVPMLVIFALIYFLM